MKHLFIINPKAGRRDQTSHIYAMAEALRQAHGLECKCLLTQSPGNATELARRAAETGQELRIYACGGDGTVCEVANGLAGFDNAAMTCIPVGTGNDFLKNFGEDMEKFSQAENLWDGEPFPLDLIDCNGRLCTTIACTGVDARVANSVHQYSGSPLLSGRGSYILSAAANVLLRPIGQRWTVTLDGEPFTDTFALAAVCNGRYYGGGSMPVPEARMNDGVLHTVLIRNLSPLTFARLFSVYSAGDYRKLPPELIRVSTAGEIHIVAQDQPLTVCLDGECFQTPEATFRLSPKKVRFFGPSGCDCNRTAR